MFARTERLMLRPAWAEDAAALAGAIGEPAIVRNLAAAPWPYVAQDAADFIARSAGEAVPPLMLFLRTHGAPRLIGSMALHCGADGMTELGYWIARRYWGLGFATEAGRAVVDLAHGSLRIPRLTAGHFVDNPASARVLRKLGFRPTGQTMQRRCLARAADVPCAMFVRDADDELPVEIASLLAA